MTRRSIPFLLAVAALAGCGESATPAADPGGLPAGLFERAAGERRDQLCIVPRGEGRADFGLLVRGRGEANCTMTGTASADGANLRLVPEGDESCAIIARRDGGRITLGAPAGERCARYYCGPGATLNGVALERTGDDAATARDLADEPLCPSQATAG